MKIAVESLTNAESFLQDGPYEAFRRMNELGYYSVELSQHIQVNEETLPEIQRAQKDFNFDICALSTGFSGSLDFSMPPMTHNGILLKSYSVEREFDRLVEYCHKLNCKILRFASIPARLFLNADIMQNYFKVAEEMSMRLAEHGITFCAHNHMDEFMKINSRTVLEWALSLAPHLCFEVDIFNSQCAGMTPVDVIRMCGNRAVLIHAKDLRIKPAEPNEKMFSTAKIVQGVEIGEGNFDIKKICDTAIEVGTLYFIIEQGEFYGRTPYESLALSAANLKKLGYEHCF